MTGTTHTTATTDYLALFRRLIDEAFNTGFELDKYAVFCNRRDLSLELGVNRVNLDDR